MGTKPEAGTETHPANRMQQDVEAPQEQRRTQKNRCSAHCMRASSDANQNHETWYQSSCPQSSDNGQAWKGSLKPEKQVDQQKTSSMSKEVQCSTGEERHGEHPAPDRGWTGWCWQPPSWSEALAVVPCVVFSWSTTVAVQR
ncbi:hypothetical protein P4O66_007703 [Electrophorus voltai]|uniref:Uncharacterized protein n=1 Tax=Electrophorus voltai TaxID=2609070 RepID=A0AAD8ZK15_9TELE|nr:hypothetical protein P4O66_007703 [Electrophorus voltai]